MPPEALVLPAALPNGCDIASVTGVPALGVGRNAVVRSGSPDALRRHEKTQLRKYGIRTLIDLRSDNEIARQVSWRRHGMHYERCSLNPASYYLELKRSNSTGILSTPQYYADFVDRYADRIADVLHRIASAPGGALLVHCEAGRDRSGLVVTVLLDFLGVSRARIIQHDWTCRLGAPSTPDRPSESEHAAILSAFLSGRPAEACLAAADPALGLRSRLSQRLLGP